MRVTGEHARGGTRIAAVEAGDVRTFYTLSSALSLDTQDQPVFPQRGVRLLARSEGAARRSAAAERSGSTCSTCMRQSR